jgi:oxygen-dependent protoporphyrinogen oxidase
VDVRLLERAPRLGGQIRTEVLDGVLLEAGPDQFVRHKPAGLALCRRLRLDEELLEVATAPWTPSVVHRGRPVRLPRGFSPAGPTRILPVLGSPLFSPWGKLRVLCEPWAAGRAAERGDESVQSFFTRRFGRELFERAVEPVVAGIFTAEADRLSMEVALPRLLALEREGRSVLGELCRRRGDGASSGLVTLRSGLGRLVGAIASRLPPGCIETGVHVERVEREGARWRVALAGGRALHAEAVVLACPAPAAAAIVEAADGPLAAALGGLEQADCATVNLVYPAAALPRRVDSPGFFAGRSAGTPLLACSHVGAKFPGRIASDRLLFRAFLGGARDPRVLERDDEALVALAHDALVPLLRIEGRPVLHRVHRASMPQFPVGYALQRRAIAERAAAWPCLYLCGATAGAFGLPDCIASGEEAAQRAVEELAVPRALPAAAAAASA